MKLYEGLTAEEITYIRTTLTQIFCIEANESVFEVNTAECVIRGLEKQTCNTCKSYMTCYKRYAIARMLAQTTRFANALKTKSVIAQQVVVLALPLLSQALTTSLHGIMQTDSKPIIQEISRLFLDMVDENDLS